jgi:ubiquinone biosynthesis protein COQ4
MMALAKFKHMLVTAYGMVMLGRHTDNVRYVFLIGNAQDSLSEQARLSRRIGDPFRNPSLERMWQERYFPARYDVDQLMAISPVTLGGAYARHMSQRGLRPDYYESVDARHKFHYLRLRVRQTHDIWHVLTGFDTDPVGEMGLQGFCFGQVTNGQSVLILAGGIIKCLFTGHYANLEHFVDAFCEGYRNARAAHFLLEMRWKQFWSESVDSLRQQFGIVAAKSRTPQQLAKALRSY